MYNQNYFDKEAFNQIKTAGILLIISSVLSLLGSILELPFLGFIPFILDIIMAFILASSMGKIEKIMYDYNRTASKAKSYFKGYAICLILFFLIIPIFIAFVLHILAFLKLNEAFKKLSAKYPQFDKLDNTIIQLYAWRLFIAIGLALVLFVSPIASIVISILLLGLGVGTGYIIYQNGEKLSTTPFTPTSPQKQYTPSGPTQTDYTQPQATYPSSQQVPDQPTPSQSQEKKMFCENCGEDIEEGQLFCVNCGAKI